MQTRTSVFALLPFCLVALVHAQKDAGKSAPPAGGDKTAVETKDAPKPIGPYSQAIKAGGFVFCAGQAAIDPATGQLVQGDAAAQADRTMKNLSAVLTAAGTDMDHAVKVTIFLKNIADFAAVNEVYAKYFKGPPPARSTVQVAALPRDALVEIDIIAVLPAK